VKMGTVPFFLRACLASEAAGAEERARGARGVTWEAREARRSE
jgi:hypothetical protein